MMNTIKNLLSSDKGERQDSDDPSLAKSTETTAPHVPGEFPSEGTKEDPDVPAGDTSTSTSTKRTSLFFAEGYQHFGKTAEAQSSADQTTSHTGTDEQAGHGTSGELADTVTPTGEKAAGEQHHYGRDAAIAGGAAGAAATGGYAAHELGSLKDREGQTHSSAEPSSVEPSSVVSPETQADEPKTAQTALDEKKPDDEHHYGRDTAIAGGMLGGAGAAGYGAHELSKDRDEPSTSSTQAAPTQVSTIQPTPLDGELPTEPGAHQAGPTQTTSADRELPTHSDPTETGPSQTTSADKASQEEHHYGRDAAIAGGATAAAGAAGYGAYELSKDDEAKKAAEQRESEKLQKEQQKAAEKQQKEAEKKQKEQQKEAEKQEKERQKEAEKRHKEAEKQEKERQKEAEKREKEERKAAEKREKEERKAAEAREKEEKKAAEKREKEQAAALAAEKKRQEEEAAKKDEDETHYGRDAAIVGGAGAAGLGAYELSKDRDDPTKIDPRDAAGTTSTSSYDPSADPQATSGATATHTYDSPAEQRQTQPIADESHHYGRDAAVVGGAGAAGVGAYELSKDRDDPVKTDPRDTAGTTTTHTHDPLVEQHETQPTTDDQHHYGRDAAVVGGVGAGAAGVGAATAGATHSGVLPHGEGNLGPYEMSGKGYVATEPELESKFATYDLNDPNPERTAALKKQILKTEEEKAKLGLSEPPPEKKEGFLHKILHPHSRKKDGESSEQPDRADEHGHGVTDESKLQHSGAPAAPTFGQGLPVDDRGHIVIQKEGAPPDAPHLIVEEKPGGGIETQQK